MGYSGSQVPALAGYFDTSATTPIATEVLEAMALAQATAWANPSSLHAPGLAAAEQLERSRLSLAAGLGCEPDELVVTSGGTEAIHLALLGAAAGLSPGRLVISAVEHPATLAAAAQLQQRGWSVQTVPVDRQGLLDLDALDGLLVPPTRLVSVIWGQNEVGSLQPIEAIGARCRRAGVLLHVDAVQVLGHLPISFRQLPMDFLSGAAHKLQGPRGVGLLLVRRDLALQAQLGGGGQEGGRRGGTEPVVLLSGFAKALELSCAAPSLAPLRDSLLQRLLSLPGVRLSGPPPGDSRLPHHLSLLVASEAGQPLSGRNLVRELSRQGFALSSGSACSSSGSAASSVLRALGYGEADAASGLRISLGPWHRAADLEALVQALQMALAASVASEHPLTA
ncbi:MULTISPECIES: aminotransferase class V-fold PLP-dependent enzyme [unclassified Cyanobium]|uniref:cysteine desulfurase family protein n=1 Tax=unclassified Cyanobium TaxID=2627006 RepID=UPI0020CDEB77|nr:MULTISPECIES: aminotransferase class V-fold PLP-dependent enzyme [unclassified Cyanobium]